MNSLIHKIILVVTLIFTCANNFLSAQTVTLDSVYYTNSTSSYNPYIIDNFDPNFSLPQSLSNYDQGRIIVDIFINKNGKVLGFNIKHIKLISTQYDTIDCYHYSTKPVLMTEYPTAVQILYNDVNHYVKKLILKKNPSLKNKIIDKYVISVPLRIIKRKDTLLQSSLKKSISYNINN